MSSNTTQRETRANSDVSVYVDRDEFTLDAILVRIGQFGKFQLMIFILICVPMLFNAIFTVTYIFTASSVVHRCNINECDTLQSKYDEKWTEFSIPKQGNELDQCERYKSVFSINKTNTEYDEKEFCAAEYFNTDATEKCSTNDLIFRDEEVTISNDFNIYCADDWKLSLVGTITNVGQFVGIPIGGILADRYGRRVSLALGGLLSAVCGIVRSFSPTYVFFLVFEFLDNVANSTLYATCFIMGIELVGPKKRVIACTMITVFYAIGEVLLAVVAKHFQNWRVMLRIVYIPALIHLAYFWILPESVRWLLSQQKEDEAKEILKRAAARNKRHLSDHSLEKLILANRNKLLAAADSKFPIRDAFEKLFWRIANCSFCWIVNVFVYYGLSLNSVLLGGNKYNNFIFIALVEIPGFFLPFAIMNHIGRRYSLFLFMLISGLCCLGTVFTGPEDFAWKLSLFLIGKLTITASFQVLYFFTSEIFPTNVRNSLLSFCSMLGRLGSMIAPQTPLLAKFNPHGPAILFATAAIVSGCLSLLFPETTNLILPTTMKEADCIGAKKEEPTTNNR